MIGVDISNIWGEIALPDLLGIEKDVAAAHAKLDDSLSSGHLGWLHLPSRVSEDLLARIHAAAAKIRENSDILIVVGIGGSYMGPRAAIELSQGINRNLGKAKGDPQILYAGNSLSTRQWNELERLLEEKDFSVVIISKSGATMEPAIAARALRWMLERRYGTDGAKKRIFAVTDPAKGALRQTAEEAGWECFDIPPNVGGRYSALTPAGLLPMAVAGMDIEAVLRGAKQAEEDYSLRSFENPAWLYAAVRNLMYRNGKAIELFESFEPDFGNFGLWWQQLFAQSEGKDGKGIFPAYLELTGGLHTLGQLIQQGQRNLFETMLRFEPPAVPTIIGSEVRNTDGLNYLAGKTLDFVEEQAFGGALNAHVDGGVPVITMDAGSLDDAKIGELFYFLQLCSCLSALTLGVDPFRQSGTALYQQNMFRLLGKPGYDVR